jgi:phage terminase large subunit
MADILVTNVFDRNLEAYYSRKYRVLANQGSTRSSKTYSAAQLLSLVIPHKERKEISVVSPSLPHLKRGARRDFLNVLESSGIFKEDNFNRTDNIYHYSNGSYIEFFGADDAGKVRGPGRDILFVNEANLLSYDVYVQLAMRTRETIFLDFNPADEFSWVYDVADKPGNILIHSTYKDNPFLTQEQINEIESLQDADENLWKVFGLGLRGTSSETIYTHWKECEVLPLKGELFMGQDFGYNVPSALALCETYEGANYVHEMLYQTKLTTAELIEEYKRMNISKTIEIFCDNAEPKTIQELVNAGYNAKPADKDVTEGIRKVKGMPLYITKDSVNLLKEIRSYKWKVDKDGKVLDEPVKFNDHCFVGETIIKTIDGDKKIIDVKEGDFVLTSQGYKKVLIKWNNGKHLVNKFVMHFDMFDVYLECTPNHLIKTGSGWKQIQELQSGQTVYLNSSLMEGYTNYIQKKDTLVAIDGECMLMYGKKITAKSQKDSMFIIRIKIRGITGSKILKSKKVQSTCLIILRRELSKTRNGLNHFRKKESKALLNGINQKKELNGIKNTQKVLISERWNTGQVYVKCAKKNMLKKQRSTNSAILTVKLNSLEKLEETKKTVYDLTVEGAHEYFANGILVHNCMDALRYAIFTKHSKPKANFFAF